MLIIRAVAPGSDGGPVGCIGEAVEFLMQNILDDESATVISRDLTSANRFVVHSDWEPNPNCSMHCMLLAGAPLNSWTAVGNGTYNGIYHELHFLNTGNNLAYRSSRGSSVSNSSTNGVLGKRADLGGVDATFMGPPERLKQLLDFNTDYNAPNPLKRVLADISAEAAEYSAIKGFV